MFRTKVLQAVSPYTLFLKRFGNSKELAGLKIAQRGRKLAKMYHSLSRNALAKLKADAKKTPYPKRRVKVVKPRKPTVYSHFVRRNYHTVRGSGNDRFKKLAAKWHAAKKTKNSN